MDTGFSTAYLGLGSNLGARLTHLQDAVNSLAANPEIDIIAASRVYESPAMTWEADDEAPPYLNAAIKIATSLDPRPLLDITQAIEQKQGRRRDIEKPWQSRTLDIDILCFDQLNIREPGLTIPHPRLSRRAFVLLPLADLDPDLIIPPSASESVTILLKNCPDTSSVRRIEGILYI
jgi:2-amino-4-hydroxy-6-hydroxymethyldihydropteridine diphosphokinase